MKKLNYGPHVLSLLANIIVALAGFISIWALSRIFDAARLGQWLLYLTSFTLADMLRSGLVHTALVRNSARQDKHVVAGSAWILGVGISFILGVLVFLILLFIAFATHKTFDITTALYIQVLLLFSFPYTISLWVQQANGEFTRILFLRLFLTLPFLLFVVVGLFFPFSLERLMQVHILGYLGSSLVALICGWSYVQYTVKANLATMRSMLSFGKYSMGTLIGANLLKSTDTFMISWFMGPAALAAYQLPYKLIEIVEIPIRSMVATYLPQSVKYSNFHNLPSLRVLFNQYTGLLTIIMLPVAIICLLFAEQMLILMGGQAYASSVDIFRCFVVYSVFLPFDRFLGITLDVLNKPVLNLVKVYTMVIINIIGNYIAITCFASSVMIAAATIVTVIIGVLVGWFILKHLLGIQLKQVMYEGYFVIYRSIYKRFGASIA